MARKESDIPVGTQFTPSLINLRAFLQALVAADGDKAAMEQAVWRPNVRIKPVKKPPTKRQRSLPVEAAVQYGLLEKDTYHVTDVSRDLLSVGSDQIYDEFARHILMNLGGVRVVEASQQMRLDGLNITGDTLAEYLTDQGFNVTVHNTAINSLRMWLARAGVFSATGWDVDAVRKEQLLGLDDNMIAALVGLTLEQQAFVLALCRINPSGPYPASEVRNIAETILGQRFARESLPNNVLRPLREAGLIDFQSGGTSGGKTSRLWTTDTFQCDVLVPFIEHAAKFLDSALTAYYTRRPADIYQDLGSSNTNVKGEALEAYAVHIMRLMGLRFIGWRKRARDTTGRAEIDVIMAGMVGGLPTRWQVQCKNTPNGTVDLEDVAKEVGLLPLTKATHILVIANGRFSPDAQTFAREVMKHNPVRIFLLAAQDFRHIRDHPGDLPLILRAKTEEIARLEPAKSMWGF